MFKRLIALIVISTFARECVIGQEQTPNFERAAVFGEVSMIVENHFYDSNFDTETWRKRASAFRAQAVRAESPDEFSSTINELLMTLETSHTYYFSRLNPKHYQLLGVFEPPMDSQVDAFRYEGIGIDTKQIEGETYVASVYDGLAAARAGLQFGDKIVSVSGQPFHPILSFKGKAGGQVSVEIVRIGNRLSVDVLVQSIDGRTMFESALESSARIIERNETQIGYLHAWSYAGEKYQAKIRSMILWGKLSQCDALVLDLRDGWGGADFNYLNLFRPPVLRVESTSRTGETRNFSGVWNKPVCLLVNGGTTSGKELFAFGFKKLGLGKIIGERTAGAVVAGRLFVLKNGDVLYLAVANINVDGKQLEGVGVQPDIEVARPLRNADGSDSQLERAVELLVGAAQERSATSK